MQHSLWLFYTVHAAGRSPSDEYLAEENCAFLVFQPVDREYLLAVHVSEPRIALMMSSNRSRNLLWSSSITTSELLMMASFDDMAADDVLYLLCHHADRSPELTDRLVHKLDVLGHERAGNRLPRFLDDQGLCGSS